MNNKEKKYAVWVKDYKFKICMSYANAKRLAYDLKTVGGVSLNDINVKAY